MDSEALSAASAAFMEAANKMGLNANQTAAGLAGIAQKMNATSSQLGKLAANLESAAVGSRAQGTAARNAGLELGKVISSARASARSQDEFREAANRAANSMIDSVSDPRMKASIRRYADAQMDAADRAETFRNVISLASKPMGALGNVVSSTFNAYQAGGTGIGTSAALLQGEFKAVGGGLSGLGEFVSKLGTSLSVGSIGVSNWANLLRRTGLGLNVFGTIMSSTGNAITGIAEKVLPRLQQEVEKQITAFMSLSSNGAVFANGLDMMTKVAGVAQVTLTQLDSIVKANKKTFAEMGEGVANGLMRVANVINAGGEPFRKGLLKLGYSVEEQAGLIADVIKDMRQTGKSLPQDTNTTEMVKEQTARYAENLRLIANITGEDAKKKMEEARQAATNLAFQQKLATMGEDERRGAVEAMALMSKEEKQAFMEVSVNGQAMTKGSALFMSQNQGAAKNIMESVQSLNGGTLNAVEQARINARNAEQSRRDALENQALGRVTLTETTGDAQTAAQQQQRYLQDLLTRSDPATVEQQIAAAQKQAREPPGSRTTEVAEAQLKNQKLNVQIEQSIASFGVLDSYMEAAAYATDAFTSGLEELTTYMQGILSRPVPTPQLPREPSEEELRGLSPQEQMARAERYQQDLQRAQVEVQAAAQENQRRATRLDRGAQRDEYMRLFEGELSRNYQRRGAPGQNENQPNSRPVQPVQPNANANPGGTNVTPADPNRRGASIPPPEVGSPEWTRQQAAAYHTSGLVVQPNNPNATALPNGPNANETEQQRQARVAAEAQARQDIDEQDEREARTPNRQSETMQQQRASVPTLLERMGTTMLEVKTALASSLEHLAKIETNTNKTALNTI